MNPNATSTAQPLEIPPQIRTFLQSVLTDANMTTLDDDMKEEMIKELFISLDNHITAVIVDNLPKDHLEAFIKMNEEKKPQSEIEQFLKDNLPNAQEVMAKAFADFRNNYLADVTKAKNSN